MGQPANILNFTEAHPQRDSADPVRLNFTELDTQNRTNDPSPIADIVGMAPMVAQPTDWVQDIGEMHTKFGVNHVIRELPKDKLRTFLKFRINFLQEELDEMIKANSQITDIPAEVPGHDAFNASRVAQGSKAADDIVDALIDLCVVAIGTLNAFDINAYEAWSKVHEKNMQKNAGVNPNRPNPLGLPDLIKPAGWTPPSHAGNIGLLEKLYA